MDKMQDTCIMVPVHQNIIDPIYAEIAIQSLNKLMSLNIDTSDLDKEAKMVEAKIKEIINKHKETHENYKKATEDPDLRCTLNQSKCRGCGVWSGKKLCHRKSRRT